MKFELIKYSWMFFLVPALSFFFFVTFKKKKQLIYQFVSPQLANQLLLDFSAKKQMIKAILVVAAVTLMIFSLMRPRLGTHWEEVKQRGVDIVIALDVSKSMLAEDVSPNRLLRAKREIIDLLNILKGDRVGLVAFSGTSFLEAPLTLDYGAIRLFLDHLDVDLIPVPGTDLAGSIETSLKAFDQNDLDSRAVILITDGEDHAGDPLEVAKKAKQNNVRIYTVGIGSDAGAPIPDKENGGFKKDRSGEMVLTKLDQDILQKIALESGGSFVHSATGDMDLEKIYHDIQSKVKDKEIKSGKRMHFEERFQWPLLLAFLLLIIEMTLSEKKSVPFFKMKFFKRGESVVTFGLFLFFIFFALKTPLTFAGILSSTEDEAASSYRKKEYVRANEKFLEAQIQDPGNTNIKYNLANTYYKSQNYDEAEKLYSSLIISPGFKDPGKLHYNLGNTHYRQGKLQEAVNDYESALKINPQDKDAEKNLAFVRDEIRRRIEEQKKRQEKQQQQQQQQGQNQQQQNQDQQQEKKEQEGQQAQNQKEENQKQQEGQQAQEKNQEKSAEQDKQGKEEKKGDKDGNKEQKEAENKNEKKEEKGEKGEKNEKGEKGEKGEAQKMSEAPKGKMSKEEAERWMSTVDERDVSKQWRQKQMQSEKHYKTDKDW